MPGIDLSNLIQSDTLKGILPENFNIKDVLQSDDVKKLLPYLISGGIGAGVGALSTGGRRERQGESRSGYVGRILRNALLTGGITGAGHYAAKKGYDSLKDTVAPAAGAPAPESAANESMRSLLFSPVLAAGTGAAALLGTAAVPGIGMNVDGIKTGRQDLAAKLSTKGSLGQASNVMTSQLGGMDKQKMLRELADRGVIGNEAKSMLNQAGFSTRKLPTIRGIKSSLGNTVDTIRNAAVDAKDIVKDTVQLTRAGGAREAASALGPAARNAATEALQGARRSIGDVAGGSRAIVSRGLRGSRILGNTRGRILGRGALGLTAAALPGLVGAYVTQQGNDY